ncbi:MAG: topA [Acidobacteria bacterium]|nr:topA [Acidobacteriota bacterium]
MAKSLIIVESPAKARTITKYLGRGYTVMASVGHVKDLPTNKLGVDLDDDFKPHYVTIKGKSKVLADIKKKAEEVDKVFLAPDPDREGEAIAWHIAGTLRKNWRASRRASPKARPPSKKSSACCSTRSPSPQSSGRCSLPARST